MGGRVSPPEDPRWRLRVRLPHRVGPIARTRTEITGVCALLGAVGFLALAGIAGGDGNVFLIFPAFGIPDLLLAWFRWRRFARPGRWAADLRATILLTGLTVYLAVLVPLKASFAGKPVLLIGFAGGVVLGAVAATIWIIGVFRERPR
jgi:hypothetical protein